MDKINTHLTLSFYGAMFWKVQEIQQQFCLSSVHHHSACHVISGLVVTRDVKFVFRQNRISISKIHFVVWIS